MINQLIKSLYDSRFNLPNDTAFYHDAIQEIETYSISSQVFYLLETQGKLKKTPLFFQTRLKQKHQEVLYQNLLIKDQTNKILNNFEAKGLEVIPLKGVYFAERYFGHIGARGTSDIDLLIRMKDVDKAVEIIKLMGFEIEEEPIPSHFHSSLSKKIPGSPFPLTVEVHWDILKEATANFKIEEFWNEAIPLEKHLYVKKLSDYHTFYLICLHGWRHNLDSPKYFLDIIQMIYHLKDRLQYEELFKDATLHQTVKRLKRTLSIVYKEYPMLEDVAALSFKKRKRKGEYRSCIKTTGLIQYMHFFDYQFCSYDSVKHSFIEISQWVLPARNELVRQLRRDHKEHSYLFLLLYLYKQRWTSIIKAMGILF
ncbi:nucleotidyltransferase family protein [Domibacillus mangrovi]|uniref:Renal dipeptidase n=1 Tax=Domibacillus mangrovi TaxID=1714354 RepID=A0A1Q5P335_9BACI|nr:nucleotidyltransferase family protein [Domibacillus mangrovi]OKL36581.1 hypothetical protein BLL40_07525 [Domibacillus mangrovi]